MKKLIFISFLFASLNTIAQEIASMTNTYVSVRTLMAYDEKETQSNSLLSKMQNTKPYGLSIYIYFKTDNLTSKNKFLVKISSKENGEGDIILERLQVDTQETEKQTVSTLLSETENMTPIPISDGSLSLKYSLTEEQRIKAKFVSIYLLDSDNKELSKFSYQIN